VEEDGYDFSEQLVQEITVSRG